MVVITLPDGSVREYPQSVTGRQVAESIGTRLAKDAIAIRIAGELKDLDATVTADAAVEIITRTQQEALEILRHDAAHILAEAVKELYPETLLTIGPAIENGFYYDFCRKVSFTPEDLVTIEARMREIVKRDEKFTRQEMGRDQAINFFKEQGESFKAEILEALPEGEVISIYGQGAFSDPCRGPHAPSTAHLGQAFKLMKLAGAYWRGDSKNPMLQRIYGTAWADEKQLQTYLTRLEEAEQRNHRKLGREMGLFHLQEEAAGSIFWHPRGWQLYLSIENYIRQRLRKHGYAEVRTPVMLDRSLWEKSGHWEKFREHMFTIENDPDRIHALKPMSCPCHVEIFRQGTKSYRDLPLRMAEFGACHRNESSGSLNGLMRVRAMTQDDGHIFCTPEQVLDETKAFCELLISVYRDFGFEDVTVRFSDRPDVRVGSDEMWDRAEESLMKAAKASGLNFTLNPGEGAFYGPKLEFVLRDALGREWQCGTLQLDFVLPGRLGAHYIGEDGGRHTPVMLHRAILGTFERFIGILIENYAGRFPLWLAPIQATIATITCEGDEYAQEIATAMRNAGLRVEVDVRNEKISYKVRELSLQKIPLICVVGKREVENRTVALRRLGSQEQEILALEAAIAKLKNEALPPSDVKLL